MSADRPPKRKTASQRDAVPPKKSAKKKRPNSPTADNLEALLRLLDDEATADAGLVPERKTRQPDAGRALRPPREDPPSAAGASSFMQELARARADLHKERRSRIALEGAVESLRSELTRLAANESAELDALHRECEGLRQQLAAHERQRQKLRGARLDLESQLDAEQRQHEQLEDQLDAINQRLTAEFSRGETIAANLEATQRECARRTIEADAARSAGEAACDELRAELASMTSRCEQAVQARDASQADVVQLQSEVAALTERIADATTKARAQDELIQQARSVADDFAQSATEWEKRLQHEQATRARVEQQFSEHVNEYEVTTAAIEARVEALLLEAAALREQLANTSNQLAASAADQQQLRAELTDARHENQQAAISLAEMVAANERLERQVNQLGTELWASNQRLAKRQNDSEVVNERIEQLEADIAKARIDLAESYAQLGSARLRLANTDRDRDHAKQREAEALRRVEVLSNEVASLQASVQREAAARRKAEAVHKREAGDDEASALFEAEQKIERLSRELAASKGVEAAYQQKAARKVRQVKQELETLEQRLAEIEQRPEGG